MLENVGRGWQWIVVVMALTRWIGSVASSAQANDAREFERHTFASSSGKVLPYRMLSPPVTEPGDQFPIVLFLHGAGERGDDNEAQLVHVARELATPEIRTRYPAFVVAPQCPRDMQWVNVPWDQDNHVMPETPSEPMALARELLASLSETLPVNHNRVYVTGLSMGGFGTWDFLQRYPGTAAAAIAICGGGDPAFAAAIAPTPVWVFHGDQDGVVKVGRSRQMVRSLKEAGARPVYTEFPGVGHNSWTPAASNRMTWDWLFAQSR